MPRQSKGARLWLRPASESRHAVWIIRDGARFESTGCAASDHAGAESRLKEYIARKYRPERSGSRAPSQIPVADVLFVYAQDVAPGHARPHETAQRIDALTQFWGDKYLSDVNGNACRAYVAQRGSRTSARRELEDLRAAINHHRREGLCSEIVGVWLPEKSTSRERWLTRSDAARLLFAAWRRSPHVARFILVGLYTGTRSGAICGASFARVSGRGYIDLERGIFYRKADGARATKKRQPPAALPPRLLAHMRRWERLGLCRKAVVEWKGKPIKRITKAFDRAASAAGLADVTPHTLRHTAATWLMQNGCDIWQAAGYLGMTPAMLEQTYGHHHTSYMAGAAAAIGTKRRTAHRYGTE